MTNNILKIAVAGLSLFLGTGTMIESAAATNSHMATTGKTLQPIGHQRFCRKFTSECSVSSSKTKATKLNQKRWKQMVEINTQINLSVEPVTDLEYYNKEEHWTYPKNYGDCEDYVLLKRYMLMQMGWPTSSLLITVVKQTNGDGHAVLTVRTDKADFILDNLRMKIRPWFKTEYRYLKRQSVKHTGTWSKIRDRRKRLAQYM
jgi:predicted transglutaminase-like cysteine proteinase